jgi:LmbE family N-acetylglucosaminyl deacetylase
MTGEDQELPEGVETMGEPGARITTEVDVRTKLGVKRAAMAAHRSQIGEESFFLSLPDEQFAEVWGQEWFVRIRPELERPADGGREPALLLDAGTVRA